MQFSPTLIRSSGLTRTTIFPLNADDTYRTKYKLLGNIVGCLEKFIVYRILKTTSIIKNNF